MTAVGIGQRIAQPVGVECPVGKELAAGQPVNQSRCAAQIVSLSRCLANDCLHSPRRGQQPEVNQIAQGFRQRHDLSMVALCHPTGCAVAARD